MNVNEAKLKDIPLPPIKKGDKAINQLVSLVKRKPLGIFHSDEINQAIYDLFDVPSSVRKQVETYYHSVDHEIDDSDAA